MVCAPVRSEGIIGRTGAQTMLYMYLTCTTISSVDFAQSGVALAKDCGIWYKIINRR